MLRNNRDYDYIIIGSGCAGLSLATRMVHSSFFQNKKILLLDKEMKKENDRTWSFWSQKTNIFSNLHFKKWSQIIFHTGDQELVYDITPYEYYMIRGVDFYDYAYQQIKDSVEIQFTSVNDVSETPSGMIVYTEQGDYKATYVFDSRYEAIDESKSILFWQHFGGWMIQLKNATYDDSKATLMDFSVDNSKAISFVYILPIQPDKIFVEYTQFSKSLMTMEEYEREIKNYIEHHLSISSYEVIEKEIGKIPMTDHQFPLRKGNWIKIGTAAGMTKASTGYTFYNIQRHCDWLIRQAEEGKLGKEVFQFPRKYAFYDSTLLSVFQQYPTSGKKLFSLMFSNCRIQDILSFLNNESSLSADIRIMWSLPKLLFIKHGLKALFKK